MARVTKTKTSTTPATAETPKKSVAKKAAPVVAATSAPVAAPATPAPTAEATAEAKPDEIDALGEQFSEFMVKLQQVGSVFSSLKNDFRNLEKQVTRQMKQAKRLSSKRAKGKGNRQPSGFVKPTLVSDELASFLGKPSGCEMARTEVTREINKYIRAKNLQDPKNGRHIIPDAALTKLLSLQSSDELTYFNLQKYMSPHFPKSGAAAAAAAAIAAASASATA
jgi:upstream activation factor subunit UAF30